MPELRHLKEKPEVRALWRKNQHLEGGWGNITTALVPAWQCFFIPDTQDIILCMTGVHSYINHPCWASDRIKCQLATGVLIITAAYKETFHKLPPAEFPWEGNWQGPSLLECTLHSCATLSKALMGTDTISWCSSHYKIVLCIENRGWCELYLWK